MIVSIWFDETLKLELWEENEAYFKRAYDLGVNMIVTDYPELAHEVI
jgi:glycerophosphoryl diester phosphodiesterase